MVSNSCVQVVLVEEAEERGGIILGSWNVVSKAFLFHLRCDCDGDA